MHDSQFIVDVLSVVTTPATMVIIAYLLYLRMKNDVDWLKKEFSLLREDLSSKHIENKGQLSELSSRLLNLERRS